MKTLDCESSSRLLKAWLDGEVDPATAEALGRHVAGCPACRAVRDDYAAIGALLRRAAVLPPPDVSIGDVMRRVAEGGRERVQVIRYLKRVTAAAAAVLILSTAFLFWDAAAGKVRTMESESVRHDAALEIVFSVPPVVGEY
jgi:predicted anti-sigma-YlaC factor YlaD